MQTDIKSNLNSAEKSAIWDAYVQNSLGLCIFEQFLNKCFDAEIHFLLEYVKKIYTQRNNKLKDIFDQEGLTVPHGFTKEDVNGVAPKLFTDGFYLWYLKSMLYLEMSSYTYILNHISYPCLRNHFSKYITESIDLYNKAMDLLMSKGLFIEAPKVAISKEVTYVKDDSFLGTWFGEPRSLLTREITTIYMKIVYNTINRAMFAGFAQVAASREIRELMLRGRAIATKHIEELSGKLFNENIPVPSISESFITDSTTAPFSEKLMLFLSLTLNELLLVNAGYGIIISMRKDLQADYTRHAADYSKYALDCIHLMIDHGWMEQPPQIVKRENLAGV